MSKIVIYSHQDIAGKNISKFLNLGKNVLFGIDEKVTNLMELPSQIYDIVEDAFDSIDLIIVASRHKSESKMPTLCVHSPGNFNDAKYGGKEKCLSIAPAFYIKKAIFDLKREREKNLSLSGYDVTLEVTHHGPTLNLPIMFVEVGSSEYQWNDLNACETTARVIKQLCSTGSEIENEKGRSLKPKTAIGIGGNHYASKFTKILLNEEIAFGHIMPKYNFNEEMIEQMVSKTIPKPEIALIDWNGLNGEQRSKAIKKLGEMDLEWMRV